MNFVSKSTVRSRRPRACNLCGLLIGKGQKYVRRSGNTDGDFWRLAIHELCDRITGYLWPEWDWDNFASHSVVEFACDHLDTTPEQWREAYEHCRKTLNEWRNEEVRA